MIRVPRAVSIVIGFGLLLFLNEVLPGSVQAIFVLVGIYLVATHAPKAGELAAALPAGLGFLVPPPRAGGGGAARPLVAL